MLSGPVFPDSRWSRADLLSLTWFPAAEVEGQSVSQLVLYLHEALRQLMVPSLPTKKTKHH